MILAVCIVFLLALVEWCYWSLDEMFDPLKDWLDGAVIELDEDSLSDFLDNSEYDWGHNIKNYMEEEL
jgi:hypothetical protein